MITRLVWTIWTPMSAVSTTLTVRRNSSLFQSCSETPNPQDHINKICLRFQWANDQVSCIQIEDSVNRVLKKCIRYVAILKYKYCNWRNLVYKWCLQNGIHFVLNELCQHWERIVAISEKIKIQTRQRYDPVEQHSIKDPHNSIWI